MPDRHRLSRRRPALLAAHLIAAGLVAVGVLVQVLRPLAPDLGAAPSPEQWFDAAHLAQVRAYRQPLYVAGVAVLGLRLLVPCLAAFTDTGRRLTDRILSRVGQHRPARGATVVVLTVVIITDLVVLPLTFWAGFVHDGAFGFRTQGLVGWAYDWAVDQLPAWLIVGALVAGVYALARRAPRAWLPAASVGGAVLTASLVFAAPLLLEPLVYSMKPLPPGPTRSAVEEVLQRSGLRFERILVADASRRTTKRNAYVSGLGASQRVVLFDTLVDNQRPDEVGIVLAHEIGHVQHADLVRGTLFAGAGVVTLVYLLAGFLRWRSAVGRQSDVADPRGAAVVLALAVLINVASVPVQNLVSRRAEAAADLATLRITGAPATYLRLTEELARVNLADPLPPRWAQALWSTHPPPSARLEMGRRWANGLGG